MAISKSQGYLHRVFCIEYDIHGAIQAYGLECVHWLVDEVAAGRIKSDKDIQRWSAHAHLYKFGSTEQPKAKVVIEQPAKRKPKVKRNKSKKPTCNDNATRTLTAA